MAIKLQNGIVFGLHTGEMKHRISSRDAKNIKVSLGLKPSDTVEKYDGFYKNGLTEVTIEENERRYQDKASGEWKSSTTYMLVVKLNFARAISLGNYCLMPYTTGNMNKIIKAVSNTLKQLGLDGDNRDFSGWTVERVDAAFDIQEPDTEGFMNLLIQNLNIGASGRKKLAVRTQVENESVGFGNNSYTWNIYVKYTELTSKFEDRRMTGKPVTADELEEAKTMKNVLRLERQNHTGAVKVLLPCRKIGDLLEADVRETIIQTMAAEIGLFFGSGDFTATVGVVNGTGFIPGIYSRIVTPSTPSNHKRSYGKFPSPHPTSDGRQHANVPLYYYGTLRDEYEMEQFKKNLEKIGDGISDIVSVKKKHHKSISGKTLEEYEEKVLAELKNVYRTNVIASLIISDKELQIIEIDEQEPYEKPFAMSIYEALDKSLDAISRFNIVVKTQSIKSEVEWILSGEFEKEIINDVYKAKRKQRDEYIRELMLMEVE